MKNGNFDRYEPVKTALKGVGFKVDTVEKQDKKTVITVSRPGQVSHKYNDKSPATPEGQGKKGEGVI
jgi:hypothetical protein